MAKENAQKKSNGSALDFEAQLWATAEQAVPAPHLVTSEYNGARPEGLCLGLIFLKYISDAFEEKREQLLFGFSDPKSEWFIKDEPQRADAAENRDYSLSASIGERAGVRCRCPQLPPEARWHTIKAKAKSPEIGKVIDDAMGAIERESDVAQASSPAGSGGVPAASRNTGRGRPANPQPGTAALHSKDVLGRVYEYFLAPWERMPVPAFGGSVEDPPTGRGKFASAEGKGGGEFYTPQCVVQVLVAMLEPYKGRVFETLQSANTNCSNRRMSGDFSLSASNGESSTVGYCTTAYLHCICTQFEKTETM
jgi:type I restriction enzyme M protein